MDIDALRAALERATGGMWRSRRGAVRAPLGDDDMAAACLAINALRQPGALELLALLNGPDDAMVERVARALCREEYGETMWEALWPSNKERFTVLARAALAAVKEAK